jgi:hypothetical protein
MGFSTVMALPSWPVASSATASEPWYQCTASMAAGTIIRPVSASSLAAQLAAQGSTPSRLRQDHDAFQFQLPRPGPAEPHGQPQPDIAKPDGGWPARWHRSRPRHRFPGYQIELHDRGQQRSPVHHVVEKEGVDLRIDLNHQSSALLIIASSCPLRAE